MITSQLWKLATGGAAIVSILLGLALIQSYFENRSLTKQTEKLEFRINDPQTGFAVQVAQCHTNIETLKLTIDSQNDKLTTQSTNDAQRIVILTKQLAQIRAESKDNDGKIKVYMTTPPRGHTLEARIVDVDTRFLETLK